ncbi:hypothetical protein MLD38_023094 [Melastoma candidum]|uniref:Uncharacterized protein n=1 Tax=Melastoma candidum TaxID=119954 RepID=A0ACB9QLD1_9MYRT|nr:hypothetical protein MLD38_023094 [Melastoma candidum]
MGSLPLVLITFPSTSMLLLLLHLLSLLILTPSSHSLGFTCTPTNTTCHSVVGYVLPNTTTLKDVQSLFGVKHLSSLLGANNLPLSTPHDQVFPLGSTIRIPFTCSCSSGNGTSLGGPVYTVRKDDGLYHIAADVFSYLVTYPDIQAVNGIVDAGLIYPGQRFRIPLPCSCDKVEGEKVVHYGHRVQEGSSVEGIAAQFGVSQELLMRLNGIPTVNDLYADTILDVPLKACKSSSISSDSPDSSLLVPNSSYVLTANNCVKCGCNSAGNWTLMCEPSGKTKTPSQSCGSLQCTGSDLYIGNSSQTTCAFTSCEYGGYTNQSIIASLKTTSTCPVLPRFLHRHPHHLRRRRRTTPLGLPEFGLRCVTSQFGGSFSRARFLYYFLRMVAAIQFRGLATPGSLASRVREFDCSVSRRKGRSCALSSVYLSTSGSDPPSLAGINGRVRADGRCRIREFTGIRRISPVVKNQMKQRGFLVRTEFSSRDADGHVNPVLINDERRQPEDPACINSAVTEASHLTAIPHGQSRPPDIKMELVKLSVPALAGQAIDPLAQLMETAYIGRLGAVELASAGVSISIFNIISKLFNIPLLSVATSFVAEDLSKSTEISSMEANGNGKPVALVERKQLSSVSTALLLAVFIGIFEAVSLYFGSGPFLDMMGVSPASSMHSPARRFLSLRALGAPAVVVSLALQGIFRGFKDTKTPVVCLGMGNALAVVLFPILMYGLHLGVNGAALSTVISQYIVALSMIYYLNKRVILIPPRMEELRFGVYLKSGGFLLGRTLAVLITMTIGTSMAARQGPVAMAAHQICMQVWLAVSLLTDSLAASAQALIASSLSKADYRTVRELTDFVLKIGLLTGVSLAAILGLCFDSVAAFFTKDIGVLQIVRTGILFVCGSQPLNALAYIFDGLHYGVSDFPYAACSMMLVGAVCSLFLLYMSSVLGLPGVWMGLALFMGLRTAAGFFRLSNKTGPWWFMHQGLSTNNMSPA